MKHTIHELKTNKQTNSPEKKSVESGLASSLQGKNQSVQHLHEVKMFNMKKKPKKKNVDDSDSDCDTDDPVSVDKEGYLTDHSFQRP